MATSPGAPEAEDTAAEMASPLDVLSLLWRSTVRKGSVLLPHFAQGSPAPVGGDGGSDWVVDVSRPGSDNGGNNDFLDFDDELLPIGTAHRGGLAGSPSGALGGGAGHSPSSMLHGQNLPRYDDAAGWQLPQADQQQQQAQQAGFDPLGLLREPTPPLPPASPTASIPLWSSFSPYCSPTSSVE